MNKRKNVLRSGRGQQAGKTYPEAVKKYRVKPENVAIDEETKQEFIETAERLAAEKKTSARVVMSPAEYAVLKYSEPMPVSRWAERYRVVENSSIRGRWKNVFTPYLAGIMDASNMKGVETVIICKTPQTGGSESGHNIVGYCIDRLPGPVMYVFPDEVTAKENANDRIIPMITASPRLRRYMTGLGDDASSLRIKLVHMTIHLAWSGSVSRLGNKPIRVLILDELDKYANPKNEARSEDLAEKRTTTWKEKRKIVKISTPTTESGAIWQAYRNEANARFLYYVRCPHCGAMQPMTLDGLTWVGKPAEGMEWPDPEEVLSKKMGRYACRECGVLWTDEDRDLATRRGEWREEIDGMPLAEYVNAERPKKVGFLIPAFLSYFVSLSEIARSYIRWKRTGDLNAMKDFKNQYLAEPWVPETVARKEDEILALCDDRPRGTVPAPAPVENGGAPVPRVACLIAGVDTQKDYFRYVIRAIGFGENCESWLVQEGQATSFSALEDLLFNGEYADADGTIYRVRAVMIDAMGIPERTFQVYDWARRHKGVVFPSQGVQRLTGSTWRLAPLEWFPTINGDRKRIPGGLSLYRLDSTYYKNMLASRLSVAPEDPGAFHLHRPEDAGKLDIYAKEMTAETWDPQESGGAWVNAKHAPNHAWDCEYLIQALADIIQVKHFPMYRKEENGASKQPAARMPAQNIGVRLTAQERIAKMRAQRGM